jgi:hypothetical protein
MSGSKPSVEGLMRVAIIEAFRKTRAANLDVAACYRAATDIWRDLHPEHTRAEAASHVVAILHEELGTVRDFARRLFEGK